jgi:hypothetical protein
MDDIIRSDTMISELITFFHYSLLTYKPLFMPWNSGPELKQPFHILDPIGQTHLE